MRIIYDDEAVMRRLEARMDYSAPHWGWTGALDKGGYARIYVGQHWQSAPAFVVTYMLFVGDVPDGYQLDHKCKITSCVDYKHLEVVTAFENNSRAHKQLTNEKIIEVYKLKKKYSGPQVSRMTGVALANVYAIGNGQRHRHITRHLDD